jgi:hypothetical protein
MRSDNLRVAPHWITPDLVKRVLDVAMPVGGEELPIATVPTPGVKPRLAIVPKANTETPKPPVTKARRSEECEAAITGPVSAASPRRRSPESPSTGVPAPVEPAAARHGTPTGEAGTMSTPVALSRPAPFNPRPAKAPDWSPEEDDRLRQAYAAGERVDLVAEELGRTVKATYSRAKKLELTHPREIKGGFIKSRTWSPQEDSLLRELYGNVRTSELPARIGRSKSAIFNRAHQLDLHHGYQRCWTRSELEALRIAHERGIGIADLASALGRKSFSVSKFATHRGYKFGSRPALAEPISLQQLLELGDPTVDLPAFRWAGVKAGPRVGRYANRLALCEQPEYRILAEIAFRRGIAAVDLAHAAGEPIPTVLLSNRKLGLAFGKRPPLAERLTREQLLALSDPAIPLPELRADRLKRERLDRWAKIRRDQRAEDVERRRDERAAAAERREAAKAEARRQREAERAAARVEKVSPKEPDRASIDRANRKRSAGMRRAAFARAEKLIDAGHSIGRATNVHVKIAMRAVEDKRALDARLGCPVEQAKSLLQRRYAPVCSMAVYGGDPDRFVVGSRKDLTREELLDLAARFAA